MTEITHIIVEIQIEIEIQFNFFSLKKKKKNSGIPLYCIFTTSALLYNDKN